MLSVDSIQLNLSFLYEIKACPSAACSGEGWQESLAGSWGAQGTQMFFLCIGDQAVVRRGAVGRCRVSSLIYLCQMVLKYWAGAHVASIQPNACAMLWPLCLWTNEPQPAKSQWQRPQQALAKPLSVACGKAEKSKWEGSQPCRDRQ